MPGPTAWYDRHSEAATSRYNAILPSTLYKWMSDLLSAVPSLIVDVGAGSGRDAAWLASLGHQVVAVEPSCAMRQAAEARFSNTSVQWLEDSQTGLVSLTRARFAADMVLVQAVWPHSACGSAAGVSQTGWHSAIRRPPHLDSLPPPRRC